MYMLISFFGLSASRKSNCATTSVDTPSSIPPVMKTIRSLRRREKMSYARSPRLVCSTTMGTRAIVVSVRDPTSRGRRAPRVSGPRGLRRLLGCLLLRHLCVLEQEIEHLAPRQHVLDPRP